uniref:Protein UL38 n=1 Tax=Mastomys natalensis cytomegalovirus 2 TaxID=2973540 RepID=A0A9Y1IK02_9BETA|nr:protein UL38 [Mastomys natalensis cytomegalovirus 2]WEG69179.1 protein UL38 [Mastomys natalensis cytomegalovirus 2]WEG69318.1 protein UL38 [Mastomys natalensis cytomegalovirus 2]WEG69456.1 protein UL38 [Mastomys natalensis cytomegalovirus 2]WEG69594.1 protein UL38 [Mastomys natalensis cytomegalovirus 2]
MFTNAMDKESAILAAKLVQALENGIYMFVSTIRECTIQGATITHFSGMQLSICDQWYPHLTIRESSLMWIRRDFFPLSGPVMIIFAVAELWKEASNLPTRQIIFMIARDGAVVAYDQGVVFYICPTLQDFWTASIVLEYDNAVFPSPVQRYVKQMHDDLTGFVSFYNKLRLQRVILEAIHGRRGQVRASSFRGNRLMTMLMNAAIEIAKGSLPTLFSDRAALHDNVDMLFLSVYWRRRCEAPKLGGPDSVCARTLNRTNVGAATVTRQRGALCAARSSVITTSFRLEDVMKDASGAPEQVCDFEVTSDAVAFRKRTTSIAASVEEKVIRLDGADTGDHDDSFL